TFYAQLFFLYARRKTQAMQGISEAFQRSRKEKEQVENVKLLLNHSLSSGSVSQSVTIRENPKTKITIP
ncbi:MAG: hypothetical protein AAF573_06975, partial [Bacteroidota bacterium]